MSIETYALKHAEIAVHMSYRTALKNVYMLFETMGKGNLQDVFYRAIRLHQ